MHPDIRQIYFAQLIWWVFIELIIFKVVLWTVSSSWKMITFWKMPLLFSPVKIFVCGAWKSPQTERLLTLTRPSQSCTTTPKNCLLPRYAFEFNLCSGKVMKICVGGEKQNHRKCSPYHQVAESQVAERAISLGWWFDAVLEGLHERF